MPYREWTSDPERCLRIDKVMELAAQGLSVRKIAARTKIPKSTVHSDIEKALEVLTDRTMIHAAKYRGIELHKLSHLEVELHQAWKKSKRKQTEVRTKEVSGGTAEVPNDDGSTRMVAVGGRTERSLVIRDALPQVSYISALLGVSERRARLLGLDKPTKFLGAMGDLSHEDALDELLRDPVPQAPQGGADA